MPSFSALGDALTGGLKAINPSELKLASSSTDALKAGGGLTDALKAGGGLTDSLKASGGLTDALKASGGATDALKAGGGAADALKAGGNAADAGKAGGAAADAAKGADEAGAAAKAEKNAPPLKTKADTEASMTKWVKDNPGKAIAAGAGAAAIAAAAASYMATNGTKVGITKIEAGKDGGIAGFGGTDVAKITYTPELNILRVDFLAISGSDCSPSIDGSDVEVYKVASKTEVWIKVSSALTTGGTKGSITLKTTPTARLGDAVGAGLGAAGAAAGGAAGGFGGALLSGLGLPEGSGKWFIVACIVLIFLFLIFKFLL